MEGPVKEALGLLEVNHDYQAKDVFRYLREDFMKPTSNIGINQICHIYVLIKQKY